MDPKKIRERLLRYGTSPVTSTGLFLEDPDAPRDAAAPNVVSRTELFVRRPTVKERGFIFKAGGVKPGEDAVDIGRLQMAAACMLACDSTGRRLFEDTDLEALLEAPLDSVVAQFGEAALKHLNVSPGAVEKN